MKVNPLTQQYINSLEKMAQSESQKVALENFKKRGLPTTKMEDWLYTKLSDVLPEDIKLVQEKSKLTNVKVAGKYQLVFLNGIYSKEETVIPEGMEVSLDNLDHTDANDDQTDIFAMINGASNGKVLNIKLIKNFKSDDVVSIVHISDFSKLYSTPRVHIHADSFSECDFVELFTGDNDKSYNICAVTNFKIKDGAKVSHTKVQTDGAQAFHVSSVNADIARDATFNSFTFTTGAKKSRNEIRVRLNDINANSNVDGLYALNNSQHCDNFSLISHIKEHTESTQLFKGVLDGDSRGVFTGKVLVCRDAQKVNSEQLNKNLLLTKKAHADTRPQLEVYADDVKCAHGATVGQMDDEEAFYLQSRGLSKERAQKLLIHAFCSEPILKIENLKVQKYLSEVLFESFEKTTLGDL